MSQIELTNPKNEEKPKTTLTNPAYSDITLIQNDDEKIESCIYFSDDLIENLQIRISIRTQPDDAINKKKPATMKA
jgi:hypothetical protein